MLPGPPCRLACPHCGGFKYIGSIMSGNTFGAILWSDSKAEYPMLPRQSPVQRCPRCGKYYFLEDGGPFYGWDCPDDSSSGAMGNAYGELTFDQMDEALDALLVEGLSEDRQRLLLIQWLYKLNDVFYRGRDEHVSLDTDVICDKRIEVIRKLIALNQGNDLLLAELHREIGEFDRCIELAGPIAEEDSDVAWVARQFVEYARREDADVFRLSR